MRSQLVNPRVISTFALLLGVAGDRLFFEGGIGLNVALWCGVLVFAMAAYAVYSTGELGGITALWLSTAAVCASIPSLRASGFLAFICLLAMMLALAMAGLSHAGFRLKHLSTLQLWYAWGVNGTISVFAFPYWLPVSKLIPQENERPSQQAMAIW